MNSANAVIGQGQTYYGDTQTVPTTVNGEVLKHLGKTIYVKDMTVPTSGSPSVQRSAKLVKTTVVLNDSTGSFTLKARRAVNWKTGYRGLRVDSYTRTTNAEIAGIVDPHLANNANGGVRALDAFLLYDITGPVEALTSLAGDAENVIGEGAFVGALTAATSQATTAGRVVAAATTATSTGTTDGTNEAKLRYAIANAISAKTTANTNAAALIGIV